MSGALATALMLSACSLGVTDQQWKLADSYLQQGQYLRAVEEYSRIVNLEQKGPMAVKAQEQIAYIYEQQLKDYPRAIRALRDVYRRAEDMPFKLKARVQIAKIYSDRMGDFIASAEEYEMIFKEFGDQLTEGADLYIAWAEALMEASRFDDAAARLSQFQTKFPGHKDGPKALFLLAQAHLAGRNYELAVETFREVIRKFTGIDGYVSMVAESYYGLGMSFEGMDDLSQALEAYKASLTTYPNPKVVELKIDRLLKRKKERRL
jgi:tetratricopeptide (TPR) repeat protein